MERDVGNATQVVLITRPEPQPRIILRDFFFGVEIRKQNAALRRREEDEDVPEAVHVGKVDRLPEVAEHAVGEPRHECDDPHKAAAHAHVVDPRRRTSETERGKNIYVTFDEKTRFHFSIIKLT